jgi:tRNA 2-thiouridine synthesizing protein E
MNTVKVNNRTYRVDFAGFLIDSHEWDEGFAEGIAADAKISGGLTEKHWAVIHWIRSYYKENGRCPLVYETCRAHNLRLRDMRSLFPTGYQRGACKLAGLTYREGFLGYSEFPAGAEQMTPIDHEKTYTIDVRGFLVDPAAWDKRYALFKSYELRMVTGLTEKHWQIIDFLRESWEKYHTVPTVYDTCEAFGIEIDELEKLFPAGYHRGAVKIAGLRLI